MLQADKMRAPRHQGGGRAEQWRAEPRAAALSGLRASAGTTKWPASPFPSPPLRQDTAQAQRLSRSYGSLEVFTDVDLAIDRARGSWLLVSTGRKTTLLRILAGIDPRNR
jgi:ATPase subunit of ABC transporter with duplicated ATPase domains